MRINNIILWTSYVNLNSYKNLMIHFIIIIPLRQAVRPYVHTPIESSFEGHFQGFLKVLGEEELRTHRIKSVFQHQPTLSLLQIFQTPVKPILKFHVTVIAAVFWTYDQKCTIFRVRTSWHDHCMLLVTNCNSLLQSNQILNSC